MPDRFVIEITDGQGNHSNTKLNVVTLTAANFTATGTAAAAVRSAISPLIDGVIKGDSLSHFNLGSNNIPSDGDILRGRKWSVTYNDTVLNRPSTFELPTALLDAYGQLLVDKSGNAILTEARWVALQTALADAHIVSPSGNPIALVKARLVTR